MEMTAAWETEIGTAARDRGSGQRRGILIRLDGGVGPFLTAAWEFRTAAREFLTAARDPRFNFSAIGQPSHSIYMRVTPFIDSSKLIYLGGVISVITPPKIRIPDYPLYGKSSLNIHLFTLLEYRKATPILMPMILIHETI
uniref:AT25528p n=1 Tax=Drosophila melanogaster TaxID=7227 RepID=Q7JQL6_DROME|nr:GH06422p [Drosophila melanogaster]AAO74708.1 AT25528p [Drosophila melanogaster]ACS54295.1 RE33791p [Drosophila melanogaster]ADX64766.1 LP09856p [Drosophila melanogaster]